METNPDQSGMLSEVKTVQQTILDKIKGSPEGASQKELVDLIGKQASYIHSCVSRLRGHRHNIIRRNGRYVCDGTLPKKKASVPPTIESVVKARDFVGETLCQKPQSPMKSTKSPLFGYDQDRINKFMNSLTNTQREDIESVVTKATHACDVVNEYATFIKLRNDLKL